MVKRTSSGVRMRAADAPPLGHETFQILVGKKATPFTMHKDLVSNSSLFFKAAINGNWKESEEGIVRLSEDAPETFDIYYKWLYFGKLFVEFEGDTTYTDGKRTSNKLLPRLTTLYQLGDKFQDHRFENAVMDALIDSVTELKAYPVGQARDVYDSLP
ncbi:hypothetical protein LTS18_004822 [Coniosporium uncinatum]|uniref:Uncharacterized protein n=1 Tax=Coniosporium uncinatum TaxID=93489 RepID=A0ACC3D5P0_9PEZI|nr:hypothetical protein LTS18_004822 [Coniosporium uncinatum]